MKIIPARKYESALVRMVDDVLNPHRNTTGHRYYMDLNRLVDQRFVSGIGTFVSISQETVVPWQLDWADPGGPEAGIQIGVSRSRQSDLDDEEDRRRYHDLENMINQITEKSILSAKSINYISSLDLTAYPKDVADSYLLDLKNDPVVLVPAYLRRLMNQIYTAPDIGAYVLITEPDIQIVAELGKSIADGNIKTAFPFPDLRSRLLDPDVFAHGILNFSPKDVRDVEHVRADREIKYYAKQIQALFTGGPVAPDDPAVTDALIDAYYRTEAGRKVESIFEVGSWLVKPLHYIPIAGELLSAIEDIKDVALKAEAFGKRKYEWIFIGVKMQEVSIKSYINRLSNNRHPALVGYRDT